MSESGRALRFGSLFSGIGGFDLGLERAGMTPAWQVEIDPKCREVLRCHWPNVPHHEDVTQVGGGDLGTVDLICGGFPCQDLSVAGRRAGLAGERSGLFYEFMRIVEEVAPRWVLIENVPGLLSSNGGRDMGAVLGVLGDLGYGYAWRILDSQYFGVPQRRRRVFIVGCAGGVCPPEVLFEPESLPGDSPPSRETGTRVAASLTRGASSAGRGGYAGRRQEDDVNVVAFGESGPGWWRDGVGALRAEGENRPSRPSHVVAAPPDLCPAIGTTKEPAVAFSLNQRREGRVGHQCDALHQPSGTQLSGAIQDTIPRRLTPRECERLQAFPDDWTRYDSGGREIADSPRYRMLGNAVTVSVAEWIGQRIMATLATL